MDGLLPPEVLRTGSAVHTCQGHVKEVTGPDEPLAHAGRRAGGPGHRKSLRICSPTTFAHQHYPSPTLSVTNIICHQHYLSPTLFVTDIICHKHYLSPALFVTNIISHQHYLSQGYLLSSNCSFASGNCSFNVGNE